MAGYQVLCGDTNFLYLAGAGTNLNTVKKVDGSGDMGVSLTATLANGREIKGIIQYGNYIYVVCKKNSSGTVAPRIIKVDKATLAVETDLPLSVVDTFSANDVEGIYTDGTNIYVGGSVADGTKSWSTVWKISIASFEITVTQRYTSTNPRKLEDFKTFTEVDPGERIDIPAHNYFDFTSRNNETAYLYKDYGASHFGNFTQRFKMEWNSSAVNAKSYAYALTNDLDGIKELQVGSKTYIGICFYHAGTSDYRLVLEEGYGGSIYSDYYSCSAPTAVYYVKVIKSGTDLKAYIYSDEGYSDLLDTLTLTLQADHTLKYAFACSSYHDDNNVSIDMDIEDYDIGEAVDDNGPIKAIVPSNSDFYLFCEKGITLRVVKADLSYVSNSYVIPEGVGEPVSGLGYAHSVDDIYFASNGKYIFKIRLGTLERMLEITGETGMTTLQGTFGVGDNFFVGLVGLNKIKKIDVSIGIPSILSTLTLSSGILGINAIWGN